jgi:hypothetical protein
VLQQWAERLDTTSPDRLFVVGAPNGVALDLRAPQAWSAISSGSTLADPNGLPAPPSGHPPNRPPEAGDRRVIDDPAGLSYVVLTANLSEGRTNQAKGTNA